MVELTFAANSSIVPVADSQYPCEASPQSEPDSPVTRPFDAKITVYKLFRDKVNRIWKDFCTEKRTASKPVLMNKIAIKQFLKINHELSDEEIDIVYSNMNTDADGKIDKYRMGVFLLNLASYEDLVDRREIQKWMGFTAMY